MADAKKCDRCNKFYDYYEGINYNDNQGNYFRTVSLSNSSGVHKTFDMCPDCMSALISFMKDGKRRIDNG